TAAGAFALSENNLYTVEAFSEYFEHLRPDGMIAITRWEFHEPREALRVVAVAMDALHRLGVANPARNFFVASLGALNEDGIPVVVLAKKTPFTAEEEAEVTTHLGRYPQLRPLYLPSQPGPNPFSDLIASNDPYAFARQYAYNVAPVNDNAPFFFFTLKPGQILGQHNLRAGVDWKVNLGVLVLLLVLVISLVAVSVFLILPLALHSGRMRHSALPLLYFSADAFERRGQPVLPELAASHGAGLDADHAGDHGTSAGCGFSASLAGGLGGIGLLLSASGKRSVISSTRICDGNAISHGLARRSSGRGSSRRRSRHLYCRGQRRQCRGVGLGHERVRQRAGFRAGDGHCNSVWLDGDPGLWTGRLPPRSCVVASSSPSEALTGSGLLLCCEGQRALVLRSVA